MAEESRPLEHKRLIAGAAEELVESLLAAQRESSNWQDAETAYSLVQSAMRICLARVSETGLWGVENRIPSQWLWNDAREFLLRGELQRCAREKPFGYAGDFQMLERICANWRCEDPLGSLFDRFFQSRRAPQAVRNRTRVVAEEIVRRVQLRPTLPQKLVSIGSGAGSDIEQACTKLTQEQRKQLSAALLDLDPRGLQFAQTKLRPFLEDRVCCLRENLFRLPKISRARESVAGDVLFCTGLFDYLERPHAVAMLRTLYESLLPGGLLLAFNFSPHNNSRDYMEWIGNWYLIHRTREDLVDLADMAGIPFQCYSVRSEPLGVNLYIRAEKG